MIGQLPQSLEIGQTKYRIRSDFRTILRVIAAFQDDELNDEEKLYIALKNIYLDFERIPETQYADAYQAAVGFIDYGIHENRPHPKTMDWEHDESILFPAINKVAGFETRTAKYLHWWTFLGYFQGIDKDGTFGYVLMIRQKRARHKKLEKWEQEFFDSNRNMCDLRRNVNGPQETPEDQLAAIYAALKAEQAEQGGENDG